MSKRDQGDMPPPSPTAFFVQARLLPPGWTATIRSEAHILAEVPSGARLGETETGADRHEAGGRRTDFGWRWLDTSVTLAADPRQGARVGPMRVPAARSYRLMAFLSDGSHYWGVASGSDTATTAGLVDMGDLAPHPPTGLAIRIVNDTLGEPVYLARVEGLATTGARGAEREAALLIASRAVAPEMADALELGEPQPVMPGETTRLAPLPPYAAIDLQLFTPAGAGSRIVNIALEEDAVKSVELDIAALFAESSTGTVDLRGRVVIGDTDRPFANGTVERLSGLRDSSKRLDEKGGFVFHDLPEGRTCQFRVARAADKTAAPSESFAARVFEHEVHAGPSGGPDTVVWRMRAARLLHENPVPTLGAAKEPGFALRRVQRHEAAGDLWHDVTPSGQETPSQIAVDDPGLYRIVRAETAVFVAVSGEVPVAGDQFAAQAEYPRVAAGRPVKLILRSAADDKPLANAKVLVSGPYSFDPVEARTSADGEVVLESVNVDRIRVEAAGQIRYSNLGPAESTAHLAF